MKIQKAKTCPFKGPNPEPKRVLGVVTDDAPSNACTMMECALYVPFVADGKIVNGNCGIVMATIAMVQIEQRVAALQGASTVETVPTPDEQTPN